ncbi:hypothetical protein [Streptomyces acidiscabies]|uniref:hypothetical protein n=1 Tax=Streptomyces acidiscabies TaxID=42234 RepID=UPI0038F75914
MAGDGGLATQLFALAKDLGTLEKRVKDLGERDGKVQAALAALDLGPVQDAIDHLEERTSGLQTEVQALAPLKEVIVSLGKQVKQLREDLEAMASKGEEKLAVWNWSFVDGMDKAEAADAWEILIAWVRSELQDSYGWVGWASDIFGKQNPSAFPGTSNSPAKAARIPPCWYRHKEAVIELSWLCQEWIKIYRTSYGTPNKAGDWHDRYAPNVKRRIITVMTKCVEAGEHQDDSWWNPAQPWKADRSNPAAPQATDDDSVLTNWIEWDAYFRPAPPAPGPVAAV